MAPYCCLSTCTLQDIFEMMDSMKIMIWTYLLLLSYCNAFCNQLIFISCSLHVSLSEKLHFMLRHFYMINMILHSFKFKVYMVHGHSSVNEIRCNTYEGQCPFKSIDLLLLNSNATYHDDNIKIHTLVFLITLVVS